MIINSPAIVIHSLRYAEADLIVTLYTRACGLRSYLLRGVLKSKRGKIRASLFQPLTLLEIQAQHKDKGTLERIKEAKVHTVYNTLYTDPIKSSLVFFISEMIKNSVQEEESNTDLYEFLESSMLWLDTHSTIGNFHITFLTKLTKFLGFYPDVSSIEHLYFNMLEGVFQSVSTNSYCIKGEHVIQFRKFLGTTFEASMDIKLSKMVRSDILAMLLVYFELHLHGFRKPKSLAVLNEIFN